ncbi:AAA family ATPase [Herbiconiux sp. VKM Ac-2851]|uniref:AAA family ATPase n=1 Tax=Herbiconiux sp. VKM Ac-2851 TaxID=2739025 RepID=UPI001563DEBD|nr:AAA family ATPase [Herbiconiux sp. VKM Ac-2851]NQX33588.1 AAA family ATPase [Herbiconiux sp. VKM Ac-2851]
MQIVGLRVEAFKSLYNFECRLDHFSVITGPNGSGKSNFVDALSFLGDVYRHGLEFAVSHSGGFENIAHRRTRRAKKAIRFSIEVSVSGEDVDRLLNDYQMHVEGREHMTTGRPGVIFKHDFSIKTATQKLLDDFEIAHESVLVLDQRGEVIFRIDRVENQVHSLRGTSGAFPEDEINSLIRPFGDMKFEESMVMRGMTPTNLMVSGLYFANVIWLVTSQLSRITVFQLSPHLSRSSGVATPNAALSTHGENLPGAADNLRRRDEDAWLQVNSAMRAILPHLTEIGIVQTEDRRLALQFKERGVGRAWNANEVSDGTIQTVALLVALFDSRNSILIIEEPENAVHPWILRQYLDLCLSMTDRQVLLTTHSPVLLNHVAAPSVSLIWMNEGRSYLSRLIDLSPGVQQQIVAGELSLFDVYDSGVLPQAIPQGFRDDDWEELLE